MSELESWLRQSAADLLELPWGEIDPHTPLIDFGLSSRDAVELAGRIGDHLAITVEPTLLWEYPTITALAAHLTPGAAPAPAAPEVPAPRRGAFEALLETTEGARER
jgi:phthiocerol/phenolphthiocerol synthesis type-I polyketide synthase D